MKHLNEYIQEQLVDEGKIGEWFKGFWNWLIGDKGKKEFDPTSALYDPKEKVRYINKYSSDNVSSKKIEDKKILTTIIERSLNDNDPKCGFSKIKEDFKTHPERKNINDNYKWISFVFKTEELTDTCGLVGITNIDEKVSGKWVVFITEFLPIYKYVINFGDVITALKDFDPEIIIKDSYLLQQLNKEEIKTIPVEDKKGYFTLA